MLFPTLSLFLLSSSIGALATPHDGIRLSGRADELPILTLPYARVRAHSYDEIRDIYVFKNIPFAAPPVGELRWREPQPPVVNDTLLDGSYGPACQMAFIGTNSTITDALGTQSEDCLFLDVYVPSQALRSANSSKLPVIHWIYGGAYVLGSKDMYDGSGLVSVSNNNAIYVASNYRLGVYGFLAGTTMEKEGLPNAGLHDVRAGFNWTRQYISLLGGDPDNVSAWGESAGAGSIYHLMTAAGGTLDPMFKTAVMQSPAFDFSVDRKGKLETQFQNLTRSVGCAGRGIACLRQVSAERLKQANYDAQTEPYGGIAAFQPAADGSFVRQPPALEMKTGNFWKNVTSVVFSHVEDEGQIFVDDSVTTAERFDGYIKYSFGTPGLAAKIEQRYPASEYSTQTARQSPIIAASRVVCNVRHATDALLAAGVDVWNMQYSVPPGTHGSDLIPTFFVPDPPAGPLNKTGILNQAYQSYLVSLARAGDPNTYRKSLSLPSTIDWPRVDNSRDAFGNVLSVRLLDFELVSDEQNTRPICRFWMQVGAAETNLGGYAPPGAVVQQSLLPQTGGASANYSA